MTAPDPCDVSLSTSLELDFKQFEGFAGFVAAVRSASPARLIEAERAGVSADFLAAAAKQMDVPIGQVHGWLERPRTSAHRAAATGKRIAGASGHAAVGLAKLLAQADAPVANSTAPDAARFDAARWLGRWIEAPQPALGGSRPSELIGTPTGLEVALESAAYH